MRWPLMWRTDHDRIVAEYNEVLMRQMNLNERLLQRLEQKAVRSAVETCKPHRVGADHA